MEKSLYFFGKQQIIAVFLVLVGLNLSAQNIEGKIVNGTGEPLPDILIYNGTKVISQSDSLGYFSFAAAPRLQQVFFSKQGFTTVEVVLSTLLENEFSTIQLIPSVALRETAIEQNYKRKERLKLGLKKRTNSRLTPRPGYEIAVKIKNPKEVTGTLEAIVLHLHKTRKEDDLTTIEIQIYTVGKQRKPQKPLLKKPIRFKPNAKNRGQQKIDLEMHELGFPPEGLYVGIKWLKDENVNSVKVGPSLRLTMWENESLAYSRSAGYTNWFKHGFSDISGRIDVPMVDGIVVFPVKGK